MFTFKSVINVRFLKITWIEERTETLMLEELCHKPFPAFNKYFLLPITLPMIKCYWNLCKLETLKGITRGKGVA